MTVSTPNNLATWRIWLLRAGYLLIAAGMGLQLIPVFFDHQPSSLDEGIVNSMLLALVLLCALGLVFPLKMLPILFWEMIWKTAWLLSVALPNMRHGTMDDNMIANAYACAIVVVIFLVVPWDYVFRTFGRPKTGD